MKCRTVNNIKSEITETVMTIYRDGNTAISKRLEIGQLEGIYEIVAFVFEDHRLEFDEALKLKNGRSLTEEGLSTEIKLMLSWISLEILNELRQTEDHYTAINYY